jgi:hypothetical protein
MDVTNDEIDGTPIGACISITKPLLSGLIHSDHYGFWHVSHTADLPDGSTLKNYICPLHHPLFC